MYAQLDLARRGYTVLLPLTEHAEFDLVAYKDHRFLRVQVKYRTAKNGCVELRLATFWADRHGIHASPIDRTAVDLFCIYCPDTDRCYYVDSRDCPRQLFLRVQPARSSQQKGIRWGRDYEDIPATSTGMRARDRAELEPLSPIRQIVRYQRPGLAS